jgi:hypothetical protein
VSEGYRQEGLVEARAGGECIAKGNTAGEQAGMTALSADFTTMALLQALVGLNATKPLEGRILDMTTKDEPKTYAEWHADGVSQFGADEMAWRFICPSCGHVATPADWKSAGAPEGAVAFSCVGRWMPETTGEVFDKKGGPCNYAGGGLFGLNPVLVVQDNGKEHRIFAFAPASDALSPQP